jgi:hypothetical protein
MGTDSLRLSGEKLAEYGLKEFVAKPFNLADLQGILQNYY